MKRAEGNFLMAMRARNTYAAKLFNPATVAAAIDAVAADGHRFYRVVQELPFDLSDTDAARALEEWLDLQEFRYAWRPTFIFQDPFRPSRFSEYPEIEILW